MSREGLLWLQHTIKPGTPELWNTEHWNTGRTPEHWWNIQLNIGRTVEIPWNSRTCEEQRNNVITKQHQEIYQYRPMTYRRYSQRATTCTTWPGTTCLMSQAFYYLHIMTTAHSAYPRICNKFSRYFHFKVIYNMPFYHNIVLCFERKYMLIYFCQCHVWLNEKPICLYTTSKYHYEQFGHYTQVFLITITCL